MREDFSAQVHSIVVPVFNESSGLISLRDRLMGVLASTPNKFEIILVNDGSSDDSGSILDGFAEKDPAFKIIHFSRNFGHQMALTAGIKAAAGRTVSIIDADLQDPPEVILEFLAKWREGADVVYGVRRSRRGETFFKRVSAAFYYRLIARTTDFKIPVDTGDFRLMDRKVVNALMDLPEQHRFLRGMIAWVGFLQVGVLYDRQERGFGETHYTLKKMLEYAWDGILAFSFLPLQVFSSLGILFIALGMLEAGSKAFRHTTHVTELTEITLLSVFCVLGGLILLGIGVIGEYLGRVLDEVRRRPLYIIEKTKNLRNEPLAVISKDKEKAA